MIVVFYAAAALAVFFLLVMAIDCNRFVIREYECKSQTLKKDVTMVLLSDLHNKSFGPGNKKLLAAIVSLDPDLILLAGDMYTAAQKGDTDNAGKFVADLARKYPVYYGLGNHEQKTRLFPEEFGNMYQSYIEQLKEAGVRLLINQQAQLTEYNMDLYGLEIERDYYHKFRRVSMKAEYVRKLLGSPNKDKFTLLIAHNPDFFQAYADWGADLTVSGHVHGGLMRLPWLGGVVSPAIRLFPKYDGGEFHLGTARMILSRGLGTHTLPIRIFNPGELVVIKGKSAS